jgi:ABC-2 type transport system permease protein
MPVAAVRTAAATRPFYWSVRRELWEHRSLFIAPIAAAALVLLGFVISMFSLGHANIAISDLPPDKQSLLVALPYGFAAGAVLVTSFIVAVFYCLGALHNERRDRSILFWKSLPVSDLTTVASKVVIPMAALPVISFIVIVVLHLVMAPVSMIALAAHGESAGLLWAGLPLLRIWLSLAYVLVILALWHAPIFGWLLLVSAWSKRAPFLWAVLPPLAICLVEKIAFNTAWFAHLLRYRIIGGIQEGFRSDTTVHGMPDPLAQIDVVGFVSAPGLWLGLLFAVACLIAAIWLRRRREPI